MPITIDHLEVRDAPEEEEFGPGIVAVLAPDPV
jgi:hypothetical protein